MKRLLIRLTFISGLLSFAWLNLTLESCTSSQESDLNSLKDFIAHSGEAVNAGDVAGEVNRFTEDGIYMWPDAPEIRGHEELYKWFENRFAKVEVNLENITEELVPCGNWAFERGKYVAIIRSKINDNIDTVHGKYLNIFQRQPDGSWKVARRIRNRDHPATQP